MYSVFDVRRRFSTEQCEIHWQRYKTFHLSAEWAKRMDDSHGVNEAGVIGGNLVFEGDYKQCVSVREDDSFLDKGQLGPVQGKYCVRFNYPQGENLTIKSMSGVGICIPDSCNEEDANTIIEQDGVLFWPIITSGLQEVYEGNVTHVTQCIPPKTNLSAGAVLFILFISGFWLLVLTATYVDATVQRKKSSEISEQKEKGCNTDPPLTQKLKFFKRRGRRIRGKGLRPVSAREFDDLRTTSRTHDSQLTTTSTDGPVTDSSSDSLEMHHIHRSPPPLPQWHGSIDEVAVAIEPNYDSIDTLHTQDILRENCNSTRKNSSVTFSQQAVSPSTVESMISGRDATQRSQQAAASSTGCSLAAVHESPTSSGHIHSPIILSGTSSPKAPSVVSGSKHADSELSGRFRFSTTPSQETRGSVVTACTHSPSVLSECTQRSADQRSLSRLSTDTLGFTPSFVTKPKCKANQSNEKHAFTSKSPAQQRRSSFTVKSPSLQRSEYSVKSQPVYASARSPSLQRDDLSLPTSSVPGQQRSSLTTHHSVASPAIGRIIPVHLGPDSTNTQINQDSQNSIISPSGHVRGSFGPNKIDASSRQVNITNNAKVANLTNNAKLKAIDDDQDHTDRMCAIGQISISNADMHDGDARLEQASTISQVSLSDADMQDSDVHLEQASTIGQVSLSNAHMQDGDARLEQPSTEFIHLYDTYALNSLTKSTQFHPEDKDIEHCIIKETLFLMVDTIAKQMETPYNINNNAFEDFFPAQCDYGSSSSNICLENQDVEDSNFSNSTISSLHEDNDDDVALEHINNAIINFMKNEKHIGDIESESLDMNNNAPRSNSINNATVNCSGNESAAHDMEDMNNNAPPTDLSAQSRSTCGASEVSTNRTQQSENTRWASDSNRSTCGPSEVSTNRSQESENTRWATGSNRGSLHNFLYTGGKRGRLSSSDALHSTSESNSVALRQGTSAASTTTKKSLGSAYSAVGYFKNEEKCSIQVQTEATEPEPDQKSPPPMTTASTNTSYTSPQSSSTWLDILLAFSLYTNGKELLSTTERPKPCFPCVYSLRFISFMAIVVYHCSVLGTVITDTPTVANTDYLLERHNSFTHYLLGINHKHLATETFFLISGFLASVPFLTNLKKENGSKFYKQILFFYLHKYIRLTPVYAVILWLWSSINWLSPGPFYFSNISNSDCPRYWWANLLYINNLFPKEIHCLGWTWFLACNFQFFLLLPIFAYCIFRFGLWGKILLWAFYLISATCRFISSYLLSAGVMDNYHVNVYIRPWNRLGTFLLGILMGDGVVNSTRSQEVLRKPWQIAGWLSCLQSLGMAIYIAPLMADEFHMLGKSFGSSWMAFAMSWLIYACINGYAGYLNSVLSLRFWMPLSRLVYVGYLVHPLVILVYIYSQPVQIYYTEAFTVYLFLGTMVLTLAISTLFTLLFEMPFIKIEAILLNRSKPQQITDN